MIDIYDGLSSKDDNINKRYGVDLAKVTNIKDPDSLNRIKCKRVIAEDDEGETDWMYICSPMAGAGRGIQMIPQVGDLVLLSYMDGDIHRPFAIGSLWVQDVKPPYKVENGVNENFTIKLKSGSELFFNEEKGKELIKLKTPKGSLLEINDDKQTVLVKDKSSGNKIEINIKTGSISMKAKKKIKLDAGGKAKIELDGTKGTIKLDAKTGVTIKSTKLDSDISGMAKIKAGGQLSLESGGVAQVKGSLVKIN